MLTVSNACISRARLAKDLPVAGGRAEVELFYVELGETLRKVRKREGLTQEKLSKRVKPPLSRAAIANLETGQQRVRAHVVWALARALGVPVTELVPEADDGFSEKQARLKAVRGEMTEKLPELSEEKVAGLSTRAVVTMAAGPKKNPRRGGR